MIRKCLSKKKVGQDVSKLFFVVTVTAAHDCLNYGFRMFQICQRKFYDYFLLSLKRKLSKNTKVNSSLV